MSANIIIPTEENAIPLIRSPHILHPCRWAIENQIGNKNLVISECDAKQSVYMYGCKDSVVQVQGDFATLLSSLPPLI